MATLPIMPALNGFSVHKRPTFATIVQTAPSGLEVRGAQQTFPLWEFELTYEVLREQTQNAALFSYLAPYKELEQISQLFLCCNGPYGRFLFEDLSDNSRTGQTLGTGDGVTTKFFFVRTLGTSQTFGTAIVGAVNLGHAVHVYLNGVLFVGVGNWSVASDLVTLQFVSAPGAGVVITADFYYYYRCRFLEDSINLEQFFANRWRVESLKFRSVLEPDPAALAFGYGPVPP